MAQVQLRDVFKMLDTCAEGHTRTPGQHKWIIRYQKHTFFLPQGQHSRQRSGRGEIQMRFVKSLCRRFDILDCARQELDEL